MMIPWVLLPSQRFWEEESPCTKHEFVASYFVDLVSLFFHGPGLFQKFVGMLNSFNRAVIDFGQEQVHISRDVAPLVVRAN